MSELTALTGTLKASELIAKLEQGYVLERLPYWSHGSPEADHSNSAGFYYQPPQEHYGRQIEGAYYTFGFGSAWMERREGADKVLAEIIREPQRYNCYDRRPDEYPDQFDLRAAHPATPAPAATAEAGRVATTDK